MSTKSLSASEFVTKYMEFQREGKTLAEFAEAVGMVESAINARKSNYKRLGVVLPTFARKRKVDVDELKRLIEGTGKVDQEKERADEQSGELVEAAA